jgi:release factor glutamine methyltransferase
MTIADALKKYSTKELGSEIELLLGYVLEQSKEFLYLHREQKLTPEQVAKLVELTTLREQSTPIAYLIGSKHFYGLNFKVNKNVLIPRPESEWIVDETLKILKKNEVVSKRKMHRVLDVGTGSGAIAVSIAYHSDPTKVQIFASDISDKALGIAKQNAKLAKVNINFTKSDLLANIKGKFDIIIANLPYVPISDYKKFYENLKHEPKLALTDGTNDFVLIKKLLAQLPAHLNPKGIVILEIDPKATNIIIPAKFRKQIIKDFKGLERFIKLTLR